MGLRCPVHILYSLYEAFMVLCGQLDRLFVLLSFALRVPGGLQDML